MAADPSRDAAECARCELATFGRGSVHPGQTRSGRSETSAPAAPHELLRRVYFDIIGLPPPADVARTFAADSSPAAFEQIVDRLLASPQFGERWARHWLDLVRYAETRGNEFDYHNPNAWQYRDYVIRVAQCRRAVQPIRHRASGGRPAARAAPASRRWLQRIDPRHRRSGFSAIRSIPRSNLRQDQADHLDAMIDVFSQDVSRAYGQLCPLPRSQIRRYLARKTITPSLASSRAAAIGKCVFNRSRGRGRWRSDCAARSETRAGSA